MELKTFDTILSEMCDNFDSLISPKSISRTNTNIIYLMFKAIAKGFEVINNVCVTLSNKFDPAKCSVEDLASVADLVGTERKAGSASGLTITVTNTTDWTETLYIGTYSYVLDDDTTFQFTVNANTQIEAGGLATFIAFSEEVGSFPVTAQSDITVTATVAISSAFTFSCADNTALLGVLPETDVAFRTRINTDTTRQDTLVELQATLQNLPYIFDARLKFNNNTSDSITYDGYTIPPYHMAVFYSGEARNELAEIIAGKGIFPTITSTKTDTTNASTPLYYYSTVFASGAYQVNVIPFKEYSYKASVKFTINSVYADSTEIKSEIKTALMNTLNTKVHKDYIKESDIYNIIADLNLAGVEVLNIDLLVNDTAVSYVEIPLSCIPKLEDVIWE